MKLAFEEGITRSTVEIHQVVNSLYRSCTYVITHDSESWLVDCGDVEPLLHLIGDNALRGVLLTHGHYDHIYGLNTLMTLFPSLVIFTNEAGKGELLNDKWNFSKYLNAPFILQEPERVRLVNDGETVELFDNMKAVPVFTPGHSPSCVTWVVGNAVFTGDSYIPGVKTVTNFPLSDKGQAAASEIIIRDLVSLYDVYPGHAPELE